MKRLTIRGTALSLGVFFDVSFVLCVLWGLALPQFHTNWLLEGILPRFKWLSPQSIVLGLVEAFFYGVYIAVVFVPLFNHFEGGRPSELGMPTTTRQALPREAVSHH